MEKTMTQWWTASARLRPAALLPIEGLAQVELMRTSATSGLLGGYAAPTGGTSQGARVPAIAPTATHEATTLLPISDVVFDGAAGIRSWSPPV
jgi:hypothetical protein